MMEVCRVRKLSQGAVTQMLDGNVLSRADIEDAVEELGKQAEGSGLTTKQVRAITPTLQRLFTAWLLK